MASGFQTAPPPAFPFFFKVIANFPCGDSFFFCIASINIKNHSKNAIKTTVMFQVVGECLENERMLQEYERLTSDLLQWIKVTIERQFMNSLNGVQKQLADFNNYRTQEKPPK